jgi:hypothetical protein
MTNDIYEADSDGNAVRENLSEGFLTKLCKFWRKARPRVPETGERV